MYLLKGDLSQMTVQRTKLRNEGIRTEKQKEFLTVEKEIDYRKALKIIWEDKLDGWWKYEPELIKYKICTELQFIERLI